MSDRLINDLAERLRHHLRQLCDERACVTPDHETTRELLMRAEMWLAQPRVQLGLSIPLLEATRDTAVP